MPFIVIKGQFAPSFGVPDGDSVRFIPDDPTPLFRLKQQGRPPRPHPENGSVQLRYEAIDAMEKSAAAPWPVKARDENLALLGTEAGGQATPGYILSRSLDENGRPICFAFSDEHEAESGAEVELNGDDLKHSVNFKLAAAGLAYPLFYDTLFHDLRDVFVAAIKAARMARKGLWADDRSSGAEWSSGPATMAPLFPKLWRRIDTYVRNDEYFEPARPLANLKRFIVETEPERVLILSRGHVTGFDNLLSTTATTVSLLADPLDLVFQP
jgi:hypothetical protein